MFTIKEYNFPNGVCQIVFENIVTECNAFLFINRIMESFALGKELFFGFYKTDGLHLTTQQIKKYKIIIPDFFYTYGVYRQISTQKSQNDLVACRCFNDNKIYAILEHVFKYYLTTIVFCPHIEWDFFCECHRDYMSFTANDYIANGYADFLFMYHDSGDFAILFDAEKYDKRSIYKKIKQIDHSLGPIRIGQGTVSVKPTARRTGDG